MNLIGAGLKQQAKHLAKLGITREAAAFTAKSLLDYKFWPHVARVDNVFGDRNPVCSCMGMENYS